MTALIVIIAIIAIILIYFISVYNSFVKLRNQAEESSAGIDVHLKQRYDLIPNLVETVKGYAKHENETLEAVIRQEIVQLMLQLWKLRMLLIMLYLEP